MWYSDAYSNSENLLRSANRILTGCKKKNTGIALAYLSGKVIQVIFCFACKSFRVCLQMRKRCASDEGYH